MDYLVISPVKDEAGYVEHTLDAMSAQLRKPIRWIIVDDGSTDATPELIARFAREQSYVHLVRNPSGQPRQPGAGVIRAFNRGYEEAQKLGVNFDLIVKLDCDLSFEQDYFEQILARFSKDPQLGIASGVYLESKGGARWNEVPMPSYHAAGACKVIRRACWDQIGGFISARGWDTVDEIRAMTRGWRTAHFSELKMKHWKAEGTGVGPLRTEAMRGEIYYLTGGGAFFFLLKLVNKLRARPYLISAFATLWGYLHARLSGRELLVTPEEARHYRALLNGRIHQALRGTSAPD